MVEQEAVNFEAVGSNPTPGAKSTEKKSFLLFLRVEFIYEYDFKKNY